MAEGFDFSGVEAMRSGGTVLASDIPVHREVYADAAEYFNPYCVESLLGAMKRIVSDTEGATLQQRLRKSCADPARSETLCMSGSYLHSWKNKEAVELAAKWVAWFNHHRLLEPIGIFHRPKPRRIIIANLPSRPWWLTHNNESPEFPKRFSFNFPCIDKTCRPE